MKTTINILLLILILFSCRGKETKIDLYSLKEDSLIYELVDSLISPDTTWRKHFLVPPPPFQEKYSKKELKENNKRRDSLTQFWDTAVLYIAFEDTLILFSKSSFSKDIKNAKEYLKYNLKNIDTSYYSLFEKLVKDTILVERRIETKEFHTNYNYEIILVDSIKAFREKRLPIVAKYKLSRIIFNEKFDKACFYVESISGPLFGEGNIYFVERRNGVWKIIERAFLWMS